MFNNSSNNPFGFEDPKGSESGAFDAIPEAQKIFQGLLAELPEEAQILVSKVDRETDRIQKELEDELVQIRESTSRAEATVEGKAEKRVTALLRHAMEQLEPLQKNLFRSGDLGGALATFLQYQALKARVQNVSADPGNLLRFHEARKSLYFRIVGCNQGPVWGTNIYTSDSHLATAAVHAGALELGEEAVVKVNITEMSHLPVRGSLGHGVVSMDWGSYPVGYRVVRAS